MENGPEELVVFLFFQHIYLGFTWNKKKREDGDRDEEENYMMINEHLLILKRLMFFSLHDKSAQ